jgi:MFS family permease
MSNAFYFLLPTLPVYAKNALGASNNQVGYIMGVYAIAALIIRPFCGYVLDAYGRKSIYLWALGLFAVLLGLYHFTYTFVLLLLVRIFHGFTWGVITTGGSTIAADIIPDSKRAQGIGYFGLAMTFSMALAPYFGGVIMGDDNFYNLFTISFMFGLGAFMLALFIKVPKIKTGNTKLDVKKIFDKRVTRIAVVMFTSAFPYAGIIAFIMIFAEEAQIPSIRVLFFNLDPEAFFIFFAAGVAIVRLLVGKIMDRKGPSGIVSLGIILTIAGLVLLRYTDTFWLFMICGVLVGMGNGLVMPTVQTMALNIVPLESRGAANATFFSAIDLGIGVGAITLGYLAEILGYRMMFFACGLILLLPLVYYFVFVRKHYFRQLELMESKKSNV